MKSGRGGRCSRFPVPASSRAQPSPRRSQAASRRSPPRPPTPLSSTPPPTRPTPPPYAASQGKPVNIKKGQFLSPWEMQNVVDKARSTGNEAILVCERGFSFGYNNLVSDMRSLSILRATGCPVVFDATHSVQLPGGQGSASGGQREFIPVLARAAVASGIAGLFMETHPDPAKALSDGPNAWPLGMMQGLLETLVELDRTVKKKGFAEMKVKST